MANTAYQLEGNAAELYEKYTVPTGAGPAADLLLAKIDLKQTDRVLDAACGTGIVIRKLAETETPIASVVGLDLNSSMLAVARSLEPKAAFPISWEEGDLCALPYGDAAFDVVLCNHGFQFVPDKSKAAAEIKRILAPGGRFAFTVWSAPAPFNSAIAGAFRKHVDEAAAASALAPFSYRYEPTIRQQLEDSGFNDIRIEDVGFIRRLPALERTVTDMAARSAFAKVIDEAPMGVRDAIIKEVFGAMLTYRDGDEFAEPMRNFVVLAE